MLPAIFDEALFLLATTRILDSDLYTGDSVPSICRVETGNEAFCIRMLVRCRNSSGRLKTHEILSQGNISSVKVIGKVDAMSTTHI
jgi:hypothetical protein